MRCMCYDGHIALVRFDVFFYLFAHRLWKSSSFSHSRSGLIDVSVNGLYNSMDLYAFIAVEIVWCHRKVCYWMFVIFTNIYHKHGSYSKCFISNSTFTILHYDWFVSRSELFIHSLWSMPMLICCCCYCHCHFLDLIFIRTIGISCSIHVQNVVSLPSSASKLT